MNDPSAAEKTDTSATEAAPTSAAHDEPADLRSDEVALDSDSPAEVRVTFILLMLAAAALCALPRQWGSAGILLGLALVGLVVHLRARSTSGPERTTPPR